MDKTTRFIAIDPGTNLCGVALFVGPILEHVTVIEATKSRSPVTRINYVLAEIEGFLRTWGVTQVACEIWGGDRNKSLQTFIVSLKATCRDLGLAWHGYNAGQVLAAVRPRGIKAGDSLERKSAIVVGVMALYPEMASQQVQDAYDAVAVGHCHLGIEMTEQLLGRTHTSRLGRGRLGEPEGEI